MGPMYFIVYYKSHFGNASFCQKKNDFSCFPQSCKPLTVNANRVGNTNPVLWHLEVAAVDTTLSTALEIHRPHGTSESDDGDKCGVVDESFITARDSNKLIDIPMLKDLSLSKMEAFMHSLSHSTKMKQI